MGTEPKGARGAEEITAARRLLVIAIGAYAFLQAVCIRTDMSRVSMHAQAISIACLLGALTLQLLNASAYATAWGWRTRIASLTVLAALSYLPLVLYHMVWGGMGGFLAASAMILLPRPANWSLCSAVVAVSLLVPFATGTFIAVAAYFATATLLPAITVHGMTRLSSLIAEVHASRRETAVLAADRERLRMARDVHDLCGATLVGLVLNSELLYRRLLEDDGKPPAEIREIVNLTRRAQSDLRALTASRRALDLATEVARARQLLGSAGVEFLPVVCCDTLPPHLDNVLAVIVREGATNVVKHSSAQLCTLVIRCDGRTVHLTMANDGGYGPAAHSGEQRTGRGGHGGERCGGLANLATRVVEVGGRLTWQTGGGRFRLSADAPAVRDLCHASREGVRA